MTTAEQTVARHKVESEARRTFERNVVGPSGTDERAQEMTYAEAIALKAAGGGGRRQVLTERGWIRVYGD